MKVLGYIALILILICLGILIYAGCTDQTFLDVINSIFGATPDVPADTTNPDVTTPDTTTPEVAE